MADRQATYDIALNYLASPTRSISKLKSQRFEIAIFESQRFEILIHLEVVVVVLYSALNEEGRQN